MSILIDSQVIVNDRDYKDCYMPCSRRAKTLILIHFLKKDTQECYEYVDISSYYLLLKRKQSRNAEPNNRSHPFC